MSLQDNMRYDYNNVPLSLPPIVGKTENCTQENTHSSCVFSEKQPQSSTTTSRETETQAIFQTYENGQKARAMQESMQDYLQGKPKSVSYETAYGKKLEKFKENSQNLSEEEYKESFKKLTGKTTEEYNQNPIFSTQDVAPTKLKESHLQRREDEQIYNKKTIKLFENQALKDKQDSFEQTNYAYKQERNEEGIISDGLDKTLKATNIGTTRKDVEERLATEEKQLKELENTLASGDQDAFRVKFKEVTGQEFSAENFLKLYKTEQQYQNALQNNSADLPKLKQEYESAQREAYGNNISQEILDKYVTTKNVAQGVAKAGLIIGATVATGGLGTAAVIGTAGLSAGAFTLTEKGTNADGLTIDDVKEASKDAIKTSAYTAVGFGAGKLGSLVQGKIANTTIAKVSGLSAEIATDTVASYGVAKIAGDITSIGTEFMQNSIADALPAVAGVLGGRYANATKTAKNNIKNGKILKETIPQKFIDTIKKEHPTFNEDMTLIYAQRLMIAEKSGTQWQSGPIDDFDSMVHQKFFETKAGNTDRIAGIKKVAHTDDKHMPIQKRKLSDHQLEILDKQFKEGSYHLDEDDIYDLYDMIRTAEPLKEDCIVYRGISSREKGNLHNHAFIENIKEGSIITRSGWTSVAPVYDYAVDRFHPDNFFGKGYIMRIKLPAGTKGIDYRGVDLYKGQQSEFLLAPNSQIKVNKIDHANQILECEYILPDKDNFLPKSEYNMHVDKTWEEDYTSTDIGPDKKYSATSSITYPNRTITKTEHLWGMMTENSTKTDITINPDGSKTQVISTYDGKTYNETATKTIFDKNGKKIFEKSISSK